MDLHITLTTMLWSSFGFVNTGLRLELSQAIHHVCENSSLLSTEILIPVFAGLGLNLGYILLVFSSRLAILCMNYVSHNGLYRICSGLFIVIYIWQLATNNMQTTFFHGKSL